jgi:maltose-binding protein MalE
MIRRKVAAALLAGLLMASFSTISRAEPDAPAAAPAPAAKPAAGPRKVVLWHSYRAAEKAALEALGKQWNEAHKDIELEVVSVPYDALPDKITAAVPRGHGPDLFIFAHDRIGDWVDQKVVAPIESYVAAGGGEVLCDRFLRQTIDALTYGDSLFGLPLAFKATALFVNKKLLERLAPGGSADFTQLLGTTDALLATGKALTDRKKGRFGLVYENTKLYFHAPWLHGFGGQVLTETAAGDVTLQLASESAAKALAYARELGGKDGIVPPETSAVLVSSLFNEGKAALAISGPWFLGELKPGLDYQVVPLPVVTATGKRAAPFLGVEALMLSGRAKDPAAAFQVMEFLTTDAAALQRARQARQTVANVATYADAEVQKDRALMTFRRALNDTVVMSATPTMRMIWSPYDMALGRVVTDQAQPGEAMTQVDREVKGFLAAARKGGSK